jgi:capsular polysaccharide biosynthesis protein/Mrp family chromosome partitioning ATPase
MISGNGGEAPTLRDYGRVLRSRSSVIAGVVALSLLTGLALDLTKTPLYRASAEVLLSRESPADRLTGTSDGDTRGDPERFIQTQLQIARTEALGRRVLDAAGLPDRNPSDLVTAMKVMAPQGSDVLQFEVQDPSGPLALRLARSYAAQFAAYQRRLDESALRRAGATVERRLAALADELPTEPSVPPAVGAEGGGNPPLYEALMDKKLQLQTLAPLQAGKTLVLSASGEPTKVRPRPKRDMAVALGFGLLVGVLFAFVLEAVDRRVDSVRGISDILGVPLLGQVRLDGDTLRSLRAQVLRRADASPVHGVEALRPTVEAALGEVARPASGAIVVARGDRHSRPAAVVIATSATRDDGRSSVMARLAGALAGAGKRVILVELDSTSSLDVHFGVPRGPGLVDVAAGAIALEDALVRCDTESPRLSFLPLGTSPGRLGSVLSASIGTVLVAALRERADLVLLNAPPLTSVDGIHRLAASVDAVMVVVSIDAARERMLSRLGAELALLAPPKLGCIVTGRALEPLPIHDAARIVPLAGGSSGGATEAPALAVGDDPTAENGHGIRRGET